MIKADNHSPSVDQYILKSAEFAHPILEHLRALVHHACPEAKEVMKWSFPIFTYKDKNLCSMAAFKAHCAFTFWNANDLNDNGILEKSERAAMGHLGKIARLEDIPDEDLLIALIQEAMSAIDSGKKAPRKPAENTKEIEVPKEFADALKADTHLAQQFNRFSPSKKKEYLQWFNEAKTESTKLKRIETAKEWIAEGKSRNWKYEKK